MNSFRISAALIMMFAVSILSGCASVLDPGPPPARLQIAPSMPAKMAASPLNRQLVVATPTAGRALDSDRIALLFDNREIRYLADTRWADTVPLLVQRNLIAAVEASNVVRGVSDETAGIAADARLLTEIRQFSLQYATSQDQPPTAVFEAVFRLVNLSNGKILGTRTVKTTAPALGRDNASLVQASETALTQALAETMPWIAERMRTVQ